MSKSNLSQLASKPTVMTMATENLHGPHTSGGSNTATLTGSDDKKAKMSLTYELDSDGVPIGLPLDLVLFSSGIQQPSSVTDIPREADFSKSHKMPNTRMVPTLEYSRLPGQIPVVNEFHMESNRQRQGVHDDGLDDEDLTAADGKVRKKKMTTTVKRKSVVYDNIWTYKGEFSFPYRTYKPKVQVPYKGGPVPQAVVAERLHRMYKRTDINSVLQTLGVELSDLIPPPNYAETNERFFQEMIFRNRVRINGVLKKNFILHGRRMSEPNLPSETTRHSHLHFPKNKMNEASISYPSSEKSPSATNVSEKAETVPSVVEKDNRKRRGDNKVPDDIHPFIKSKPPFGYMLPIHCFDNTEFDIRPPLEWMSLGWDVKDGKFYPLPGKAFLPLPGPPEKQDSKAISETAVDNLLSGSPRLNKMYHLLLEDRFQRTLKLLGIDPLVLESLPQPEDMVKLARLVSTVPPLFQMTSEKIIEKINIIRRSIERAKDLDSLLSFVETGDGSDSAEDAETMLELEDITPPKQIMGLIPKVVKVNSLAIVEVIASTGSVIPVRNVFRRRRLNSDGEEEDYEGEDSNMALELYDEDFEGEEGSDRNLDMDDEFLDYDSNWDGDTTELIMAGDYTLTHPHSIDQDAYTRGFEKYVVEFDKMKKVHIHDWKWVEVAIFDYNEETDKFYVRSIYPPLVHAWVDKIYLCFDGEDPKVHGKRIHDAAVRRIDSENTMRFNLYIDCLPLEKIPGIHAKTLEVVLAKTLNTPKLKHTEQSLDNAKKEMDLEHKRTNAKIQFIAAVERHPHLYKTWVTIPQEDEQYCYMYPEDATPYWQKQLAIREEIPDQKFSYKKVRVLRSTVRFGETEPRDALNKVRDICLQARNKHKLILLDLAPMTIDEWEQTQMDNLYNVREFLKNEWQDKIVAILQEHLSKIPRSWYNLKETNYDVFELSKMKNYLALVRIMMEDTMRYMVTDSLEAFRDRLHELSSLVDNRRRFSWDTEDLTRSLFPPPEGVQPIWSIGLVLDRDFVGYTHQLSSFPDKIRNIVSQTITCVQNIPTVLVKIMPQMRFAFRPYMLFPEESEHQFQVLEKEIQKGLKRSLLPVDSYVFLYQRYLNLMEDDVYLHEWNKVKHRSVEVEMAVVKHKEEEQRLEVDIPKSLKVTAFEIHMENVIDVLIQKKKFVYTTILDNYAEKLRRIINKIHEEYEWMEQKLNTRPDPYNTDEVNELKIFVTVVPKLVDKLQEITLDIIQDYEVFDQFLYNISDEDFAAKWDTAVYAWTILKTAKKTVAWLVEDYDNMAKEIRDDQLADEGAYDARMDENTCNPRMGKASFPCLQSFEYVEEDE